MALNGIFFFLCVKIFSIFFKINKHILDKQMFTLNLNQIKFKILWLHHMCRT